MAVAASSRSRERHADVQHGVDQPGSVGRNAEEGEVPLSAGDWQTLHDVTHAGHVNLERRMFEADADAPVVPPSQGETFDAIDRHVSAAVRCMGRKPTNDGRFELCY